MKHRFKIVGKFKDPRPYFQIYGPDQYVYFVVYRCVHCKVVWRVERDWPWKGKLTFEPTWINCPGRSKVS